MATETKIVFSAEDKISGVTKTIATNLDGVAAAAARIKSASAEASGAMGNMGVSAAQTANAMRQLPAQFTDIVVSLQGGQKPLTVLLQQGGQIKDMFGGTGNAIKALSGYVLGMVNPLTVVGAAVAGLGLAYQQGAAESSAFGKALLLTGNAAGTSVDQLRNYASAVASSTGATKGAAAEALTLLAATGKVGAASLNGAAEAAVRFERATSGAVAETVKNFTELGRAPAEASLKLNEQYNYLTAAVYEQIKALESQGRSSEAAALAQKTYGEALDRVSKDATAGLGMLEKGWLAVKDGAKGAWDSMLNLGREQSFDERIKKLQEQLAAAAKAQANARKPGFFMSAETGLSGSAAESMRQEIIYIEQQKAAAQELAAIGVQQRTIENARLELAKEGDKFLTKRKKEEEEILRARQLGLNAGWSEEQIQKRIADIQEKNRDKGFGKSAKSSYDSIIKSINERLAAETQQFELGRKLTEEEEFSVKVRARMAETTSKLSEQEKRRLEQRLNETTGTIQANRLLEERRKTEEDLAKSIEASLKPLRDQAQTLEDQIATFGLSDGAIQRLSASRLLDSAATLEQVRAMSSLNGASEEQLRTLDMQIAGLTQQAELRKKNAALLDNKEAMEAGKKAIEDQRKTAIKAAEDINDKLTDAILRGFESGKSFAENFRDTVKNMFSTLVLRPIISAVISPVSGAISAMLSVGSVSGVAGAASGISGLSNLFGLGSAVKTGSGMISGGYSALSGKFNDALSAIGIRSSVGAMYGTSASAVAAQESAAMAGSAGTGASAGSSAIPIVGWILAAMSANNSLYDRGWQSKNNDSTANLIGFAENFADKTLQAIGVSPKLASLISGSSLVSRVIGFRNTRADAYGIQGSIGSSGFSGSQYQDYSQQGGLFRSDKRWTETSGLSAENQSALDATIAELYGKFRDLAKSVGANAALIDDYTIQVQQQLSSNGDDNSTAALTLMFSQASDAMASTFLERLQNSTGGSSIDQYIGSIARISDAYRASGQESGAYASFVAALVGVGSAMQKSSGFVATFGAAIDFSQLEDAAIAGETVITTLARLTTSFDATNNIADLLGQDMVTAFGEVGLASLGARDQLIGFMGGMETLGASMQTYYQNFFSEEERSARLLDSLGKTFADLNLTLPKTREEFRALIEAQDLTSESGRQQFANLIGLSATFASAVPASIVAQVSAVTPQQSYDSGADAAASAAERIASERASLEQKILQLQGDTTALRNLELAALDATNRPLQERIYALEDEAAATELARQATERIAGERAGLEQKILQLQGDTTGLRNLELAALDATNRPLQERIYALEDEAAATEQARQAAERIATARASLEQKILQLQGDTTGLRNLELAALDAANRPLQERIYALEDEAAANAAAAASIRATAELRATWQDKLDVLTGARSQQQIALAQDLSATSDTATKGIIELVYAMQAQQASADAAAAALRANAEAAYQAVQKSAEVERARLAAMRSTSSALVSQLSAIFDAIGDGVARLRGAGTSASMRIGSARAYIDSALLSGVTPDQDKLVAAINAVTADSAESYTSRAEFSLAQLRQAAKLEKLGDLVGDQKTVAERQLEALDASLTALDEQLKTARDQLDATKGIATTALSMSEALSAMAEAIQNLLEAGANVLPDGQSAADKVAAANQAKLREWVGVAAAAGTSISMGTATQVVNESINYATPAQIAAEWNRQTGNSLTGDELIAWARAHGIPGYASGGLTAGGLALVGERGPELLITPPSQIMSNASLGNVFDLRPLLEEMALLRAETRSIANSTNRTAKSLDRVMPDGDAIATREVAA